jgi:hypothetical protein
MLQLDSATAEIFQIAGLLTVLLFIRKRRLPITQGVCVWCVIALSVDVFWFQCVRPSWIQEAFNTGTVLLSLGMLYENYKELCRAILVFLVSLFK